MRFELAIALRYLRSRERERSLSLITAVAVGGVALGVGALVVALSVMNGYQANMVRAMAGALPHLSVIPPEREGFHDAGAVRAALEAHVQPVGVSPFLLQEALVSNPKAPGAPVQGVMLRGVEPAAESAVTDFLVFLSDGSPDWGSRPLEDRLAGARRVLARLEPETEPGVHPILLSPTLAKKLGVGPGEALVPLAFPRRGEGFSPVPAAGRLRVAGYFETGILAFDELVVLIHVGAIERIYPANRKGYSLGVRLAEPLQAGRVAGELRALPMLGGERFLIYSWLESNRSLFRVIELQKVMLFIVLMLIVVIAFFGIVGALVMLVIDKSREIAVLKSLGARDGSVRLIFFVEGVLIGVVGTLIGLGVGLAVCWALDSFALIEIPPGVYPGSDRIPVLVSWADLALVAAGTMAISLGATVYPAMKAMRLPAVNALRYT